MDASAQPAVHAQGQARRPADRTPTRPAPGKAPPAPLRATGVADLGLLDRPTILSLQASAGNAAVASLLAPGVALQREPVAAAARSERQLILDKLHADSKEAANQIATILKGSKVLWAGRQDEIMEIIRHWAKVPGAPNSNMTGMDWLIAGLRQNTYQVGWVVDQTTSAFDELHHRMDSGNVAEFQRLTEQAGRQFKNEKPIELARFEVSQEDIIRGLQAGGELAAAMVTGGGSMVLQIVVWLGKTLPGLWSQLKAVFSLVDAIKGFRSSGVGSKFSEPALGALAVEGLFGEISGLPVLGGPEPPKAEAAEGEASQSGLTKVLMMIVHGITVVKSAYNKIATKVNGIIHSIDISQAAWLPDVAAVYAGITQAKHLVEDPLSAFKMLVDKAKEMVGGFFDKITGQIGEVVGGITEKLGMIVEPVKLIGHLADRLVSTVLNFIITHPPSALLQTVFSVIQTAAGTDLIDLVRQQLKPVGDEIIAKIAHSDVVQTAIAPIKGPVHKISEAIGKVVSKGVDVVKGVQSRVAAFLNPEKLQEMTGLGSTYKQPTPVAEAAAAPPTDFLGAVKEGLHARLMMLGNSRLISLAKSGAKFLWEKAKSGAKAAIGAIKGAILGKRNAFEAAGEHHELWAEQTDKGPRLMMASKPVTLQEKIEQYKAAITDENVKENQLKELYFQLGRAEGKAAEAAAEKKAAAAADELEDAKLQVVGLVKQLEGMLLGGGMKEEYHQDGKNRPMLAAAMLKPGTGSRDMGAEQEVSRPLTQLMEYLQQEGGKWSASAEYSSGRPKFDAAHLIGHDFGGRSGAENLVPVEARVNKSFMGTAEGRIRDKVHSGARLYMMVRCVYKDPPFSLGNPYEDAKLTGKNAASKYKPGTRVEFNLMALQAVPDEVNVKVINVSEGGKEEYNESYPTGGPIIDWVGKTRAALAEAGDTRGEQILDPAARAELVDQAKK